MLQEPDSPLYLALNVSKVANTEASFELMRSVGPKVCITTASHPGFVGFQANVQTGVLPFAGRYGGAKPRMPDLNPIRNYQYTMWKRWQDHDEFHQQKFDRVFELCASCLGMVVEGPWEPVYRVVSARMPPVKTSQELARFSAPSRCVAIAEHAVLPGAEPAFEAGATGTMEALADSAGFQGSMILKQIGVSALGSFMFDPRSMGEALETLGSHPPKNPKPLFSTLDAAPNPPEYLIHSEWDSPEAAQLGLAKVLVNHRIRRLHDDGVMANLMRGPYVLFFQTMMEEPGWRTLLR